MELFALNMSRNNDTFRVYVVMPLLPAFEGEIGTTTGTSIQAVTHWNYTSICRGGNSLLERLLACGGNHMFNMVFVQVFENKKVVSPHASMQHWLLLCSCDIIKLGRCVWYVLRSLTDVLLKCSLQ